MAALSRVLAYMAVILLPLALVAIFHLHDPDPFIYNIGRCFALLAFPILVAQVILASRLKWVERPFGLNLIFPFHRRMGAFVTLLLLCHPLLLAAGGSGWPLLIGAKVDWFIWPARAALLLLLINACLSLWRPSWGIKYEKWRLLHDILGPAVLVLAFVHSWYASGDLKVPALMALWVLFLVLAVLLFGYHRLLRPRLLARAPYQVTAVQQETHNVWTIKFAPPPGLRRFDFLPGQFQFVTLRRGRGLPVEEHHFTISSAPGEPDFHASTIKESGDFTATIKETRAGDQAAIHAPFGRFSYLLHPGAHDWIFIAGGIGITPLMSNLRHMRDTQADRRVLLLYSNKTAADIVFREELLRMEAGNQPDLKVVHLLTQPGPGWPGETGRLDREKMVRLAGDRLSHSTFFLCCPPPMLKSLVQILRELGVKDSQISFEYFAL